VHPVSMFQNGSERSRRLLTLAESKDGFRSDDVEAPGVGTPEVTEPGHLQKRCACS
jgi:hypothetical protein